MTNNDTFIDSLKHSFLNQQYAGLDQYNARLVTNDPKQRLFVLNTIQAELEQCSDFIFSVAFITDSGLNGIKSQLADLDQSGIKGRLITSDYLTFNAPKVFYDLLAIPNLEVRINTNPGFHPKGYLFKQKDHQTLIIGSSNLTMNAMKQNYEWNLRITSFDDGEVLKQSTFIMEDTWENATPLDVNWIKEYENYYKPTIYTAHSDNTDSVTDSPYQIRDTELNETFVDLPLKEVSNKSNEIEITPNSMQIAALEQLKDLRDTGAERGLVISATGTGKTYLAALDVKQVQPDKMLFIVHREQILRKAMSEFKRIIGGEDQDYGLLVGAEKNSQAKYLFATIQTLSKSDILTSFNQLHFDYILVDEVHKAGANSYQKVLDYFKPKFLLGMTATPERTDGFNIFEMFDYNIAYEIRLQDAMAENMLCPFHYFGVTDFTRDNEVVSDTSDLAFLIEDERINHLINKMNYYGHAGKVVKGLVFCSRKKEARDLSDLFNQRGYKTISLTGEDDITYREAQIALLEQGLLQYIFTVDVFNEGIDIPQINQVVLLRQTQSSIIFIQQMGRGLRKSPNKDFVTIIDFIGNYKNNYLIPIALTGDNSASKDKLRRGTMDTSYISGVSTINFEEVAKEKIYASISTARMDSKAELKKQYTALKNRLDRIPTLVDFMVQQFVDPQVVVGKTNYYAFLKNVIKEEIPTISTREEQWLRMISGELMNGKRPHELTLLNILIHTQQKFDKHQLLDCFENKGFYTNSKTVQSVINVLTDVFFQKSSRQSMPALIEVSNGQILLNPEFQTALDKNATFKLFIEDALAVGIKKAETYNWAQQFTPASKYTRKDVCRLLNWPSNQESTVYGYKTTDADFPIFVTLEKTGDIAESTQYEDELLSNQTLRWFTKSRRHIDSAEVIKLRNMPENGLYVDTFVKKNDDEGTEFYYLGQAQPVHNTIEETKMPSGESVVKMQLKLAQPLDYAITQYLQTTAKS